MQIIQGEMKKLENLKITIQSGKADHKVLLLTIDGIFDTIKNHKVYYEVGYRNYVDEQKQHFNFYANYGRKNKSKALTDLEDLQIEIRRLNNLEFTEGNRSLIIIRELLATEFYTLDTYNKIKRWSFTDDTKQEILYNTLAI